MWVSEYLLPRNPFGIDLKSEFLMELARLFTWLPEKRQRHLNDVTQLAYKLMNLRSQKEQTYPVAGTEQQKQQFLGRLMMAYNVHDIGDVPIMIPETLLRTPQTDRRRREIQSGDWISYGDYDKEKFDSPIRGHIVLKAIEMVVEHKNVSKYDMIIEQLKLPDTLKISSSESKALDIMKRVAFQHHEYYDGKGWPRGIKLDPFDPVMDITFFDFIAGWFSHKQSRGDHPTTFQASTPAQVLKVINERQEKSLRRSPSGEPMYNRYWVDFVTDNLHLVDPVVDSIFADVKAIRT